ncbi:hypothetical protein G3N57_13350 [Paraburkholderia sp. Se-20369]|nr:hypothetical protein [Paraburkholderia sp. Se-20369]
MKPSDRLSLTMQIAELRALQLSRERATARQLAAASQSACMLERDAASRLEAIAQIGRSGTASACACAHTRFTPSSVPLWVSRL